jgi:chloramphenicol O-acetyltransferase
MLYKLKNLFASNPTDIQKASPGRTFKRILTSDYFGNNKETQIKIVQKIQEYGLQPKYINYTYQGTEVISAHVAFQKEVLAEKWNMLHITEISFTIYANDFEEFEEMSKVCLETDFRDVSVVSNDGYQCQERRQQMRD